jgi:hypothetical protein
LKTRAPAQAAKREARERQKKQGEDTLQEEELQVASLVLQLNLVAILEGFADRSTRPKLVERSAKPSRIATKFS